MGRIWNAANQREGYKLDAEAGWLVESVDLAAWTCRGLFRYFSGRPLLGDRHRKTDATFLRAGTAQLYPKARPPFRWSFLPEWKRAAIRIGMLILAVTIPWAYFGHGPGSLISALVSVFIVGNCAWALGSKTMGKALNYKHRRDVERPLQAGLAPVLGINSNQVRVKLPRQRKGKAS